MEKTRENNYGFTDEEIEEMFYHHPKTVYDAWMQPEEDIWDELFDKLEKEKNEKN